MTLEQRALHAGELLQQIVDEACADVVLLDNTEILFDPSLHQDPLRLLQGVSRARCVVAAWNGEVQDNHLVYAEIGHAEYQSYQIDDLLIAKASGTAQKVSHPSEE